MIPRYGERSVSIGSHLLAESLEIWKLELDQFVSSPVHDRGRLLRDDEEKSQSITTD